MNITSSTTTMYQPLLAGGLAAGGKKPPMAGMQLSSLDTDGDGQVSETEFKAGMEKNAPAGADKSKVDQMADKMFKKIDGDGDGQISAAEWGTFQQKIASGHHHHHAASNGSQADNGVNPNGDNTLSQDQLAALLQKYEAETKSSDPSSQTGDGESTSSINIAM